MLALVTAQDLGSVSGLILASLGVGSMVGRKYGTTKKQRAANSAIEQAAKNTVQQLTWAVAGKPKDQWGDREPGIIEQMAKTRDDLRNHVIEDMKLMADVHSRLLVTETSQSSAAIALATAASTTADALAKRVDVRDNTADLLAALALRLDAIEHSST